MQLGKLDNELSGLIQGDKSYEVIEEETDEEHLAIKIFRNDAEIEVIEDLSKEDFVLDDDIQ